MSLLRLPILLGVAFCVWRGMGRCDTSNRWTRLIESVLFLVSCNTLLQVIGYYASVPLSIGFDAVTIWIAAGLHEIFLRRPSDEAVAEPGQKRTPIQNVVTLALAASSLLLGLFILWHARRSMTLDPILSPWNILPTSVLGAFGLLGLTQWIASWKRSPHWFLALNAGWIFLLFLAVPILTYPLGFGFDGFLHRAGEQVLLDTGTLSPKPPYYIGQYVFVTWIARVFHASLPLTDTLFLPALLALIPIILHLSAPQKAKHSFLFTLLLFTFPLAGTVSTTPQAIAYVLGFLALFLCAHTARRQTVALSIILALWAAATHPIAGLPILGAIALCLWTLHTTKSSNNAHWSRQLVAPALILATCVSVPAAFALHGSRSGLQTVWTVSSLFSGSWMPAIFDTARGWIHDALWPDWSSLVNGLFPFATLVAAWSVWRTKNTALSRLATLGTAVMLTGIILPLIARFPFLIDYEQADYGRRLILVGMLILLVPALEQLSRGLTWIQEHRGHLYIASCIVIPFVLPARLYHALPYHDISHEEHGWSVGIEDIEAVRLIDQDAGGKPYTVLANQSVSAAAVSQFGFKRYAGGTFFYPIPTGGELYALFLRAMSPTVTRDDVQQAATLGRSPIVYAVVNDYWWDAKRVIERLSAISDAERITTRSKVHVYRFDFSTASNSVE